MAILNIDRNLYPAPISVKVAGAMVNGQFVNYEKGDDAHNREIFSAKKLDGKSNLIAFVCEPFHPYHAMETEADMKFEKGDIVRAEPIGAGKEITVSVADCIDGAVKAGDKLKPKATSYQLEKDATGENAIAIVLEETQILDQKSVRIRFI